MDKSAPWTVLQGTLSISALSAATTGLWGIFKSHEHYGFLAGAAALNSGLTAAAFFTMREYIISPILVHIVPLEQYERRRRELRITQGSLAINGSISSNSDQQFSLLRSQNVLDSGLSGMAAGGLLRGLKSGPRAVMPGAITVGVAATLLQLGYNELKVQRLKLISRQRSSGDTLIQVNPQPGPTLVDSNLLEQEPASWKARALSFLGVRRLSEDEYLQRLKLQREQYLQQIAELEQRLKEEKKVNRDASSD